MAVRSNRSGDHGRAGPSSASGRYQRHCGVRGVRGGGHGDRRTAGPKHHGDNDCEWDPFTGEVICPPPTWTPTRTAAATHTATAIRTATRTATPTATATHTPTPTATPTHTPTRTRTPSPTGWVTAPDTSISVGGSVTVRGGWSPASLTTRWHITDESVLWRSSRCSGTSGRGASTEEAVEPEASLTVYGCAPGSSTVQLKITGTNTVLGSVTIRVTGAPAVPVPPGQNPVNRPDPPDQLSPTQVAYRWLRIEWDAHPAYARFKLEAKDGNRSWGEITIVKNGSPRSGPRAIVDNANRTADVRGFIYRQNTTITFRVTGITSSGFERVSAEFAVDRSSRPEAAGHLHDHALAYNLSRLSTIGLGADIAAAAQEAAAAWNRRPTGRPLSIFSLCGQHRRRDSLCGAGRRQDKRVRRRRRLRGCLVQHRGPYRHHYNDIREPADYSNALGMDQGQVETQATDQSATP